MMVAGMSTYNLLLHQHFTWGAFFKGLLPGLIVAFLLDEFVVGKLAKKIAFSLLINREKQIQVILAITFCMVLGMVTCMSLFGVMMEVGIDQNLWSNYLTAWGTNFIFALPLQLLVVGPISRGVLGKIQESTEEAKSF